MAVIICEMCGKETERTGGTQKYCPECRKLKEKYRKRKNRMKQVPTQLAKKTVLKSVVEIAAEAARHHMTYGQYVASLGR